MSMNNNSHWQPHFAPHWPELHTYWCQTVHKLRAFSINTDVNQNSKQEVQDLCYRMSNIYHWIQQTLQAQAVVAPVCVCGGGGALMQ